MDFRLDATAEIASSGGDLIVAIAVNLSAFFIIIATVHAAPGGHPLQPETKRAELADIWELFGNNTGIAAFWHAVTASFLVAGTFVAAVCAWWMVRSRAAPRLGRCFARERSWDAGW